MTPENTARLIAAFPKLFRHEGPHRPRWFECDDGWFQIVWDLCTKLNGLVECPELVVSCVKEKFGGLRVYLHGLPYDKSPACERAYGWIADAENASYLTCEICGAVNPIKTVDEKLIASGPLAGLPTAPPTGTWTGACNGYWIRTLCPAHQASEKAEWEKRLAERVKKLDEG